MSDHVGESGDAPDTFDDRLEAIARLIEQLDDQPDPARRHRLKTLAVLLLARLGRDAMERIADQLDRIELQ